MRERDVERDHEQDPRDHPHEQGDHERRLVEPPRQPKRASEYAAIVPIVRLTTTDTVTTTTLFTRYEPK